MRLIRGRYTHALTVVLAAGSVLAVTAAPGVSPWEDEVRAYERADRERPPPQNGILFIGSSSIRLWKTLPQDFPGLPVINRGIGGSQIHEVTALIDRLVVPYRPRLIVFYCGSNDLARGRTVSQVLRDFDAFVTRVHTVLPEARIAFLSIAPNPARWALVPRFRTVNRSIARAAAGEPLLDYIDVFGHMLRTDGRPRREIFVEDRLHMNAKGYAIWREVIGEYLAHPTSATISPPVVRGDRRNE
jgi:lysophospholipase L1-like esterase